MPKTALLYDIHGNLPALEAVLAHAGAAGAERFVLGGDYALFGPYPVETVAALRELPGAEWIRGNVDRWCAHPDQAPDDELIRDAIAACREALGAELVAELDEVPELVFEGERLFCHASPLSDVRSFFPEPAGDEEHLLTGIDQRLIVFGHTHLQFRRVRSNEVELVNPGSVGLPFDGDHRAAYALMNDDGSLELRRAEYDHEASSAAMVERFGDHPWTRRTVNRLRFARL